MSVWRPQEQARQGLYLADTSCENSKSLNFREVRISQNAEGWLLITPTEEADKMKEKSASASPNLQVSTSVVAANLA